MDTPAKGGSKGQDQLSIINPLSLDNMMQPVTEHVEMSKMNREQKMKHMMSKFHPKRKRFDNFINETKD